MSGIHFGLETSLCDSIVYALNFIVSFLSMCAEDGVKKLS